MKTFAIKARKKLIDEILDRIQMFSLDSKTELPNLLPKNPVKQECFLQLQRQIEENDVLSVAEQAACVWFHRLVSIWFMEVRAANTAPMCRANAWVCIWIMQRNWWKRAKRITASAPRKDWKA